MVTAVWDTGANYSVIDETVIDKLKLSPSGTMPSQSTNADSETRNTGKKRNKKGKTRKSII
jgi:predicted aspartyl protease